MNVVYANLKIALFTGERGFAERIVRCLSGHTVTVIDPTDSSTAIKFLSESRPDFLLVDSDGDRDLALKLVIQAAAQTRILFFMDKLDQRLVLAAKDRGADAVLLKENSDERIRERMGDLLSGSETEKSFYAETPAEKASGVLSILFSHTPRQAIHLILDYLHNR